MLKFSVSLLVFIVAHKMITVGIYNSKLCNKLGGHHVLFSLSTLQHFTSKTIIHDASHQQLKFITSRKIKHQHLYIFL